MKKSIIFSIAFVINIILPSSGLYSQAVKGYLHIEDPEIQYANSGEWKFHYGDDMKWADPGYDDSRWEIKKIPSRITPLPGMDSPGWFWIRLHFKVNKNVIESRPLYLSIFRFFHAYEVYLNGKKIGGRGTLPEGPRKWKWAIGGFSKICSPLEITTDKDNVVALRVYEGYDLVIDSSMINYGVIGSYKLATNYFLLSSIITYILSAISLIIGIYHIFVFRREDDNASLWYALFMITLSAMYVLIWLPEMLDTADTQFISILFISLLQVHFIWFTKLSYSLAEKFLNRFRIVFPSIITALTLSIIIIIAARSLSLVNYIFISMIAIILLISTPILLYLLITEIRSKDFRIKPIIFGAIIGILSLLVDILQYTGLPMFIVPRYLALLTPIGIFVFAISLSFSIGIRYSDVVYYVRRKGNERKQTFLKGIDIDTLDSQLTNLMEKDKIFIDETLSINRLSEMLDLTTHQLSEFLNEKMKMNFNSYINKYRIEEAIRYLKEDPKSSITSIAFKVGFNSSSRFYIAFKQHTGKKPKDFRI
jgi:AraC-like DNA-binding protein